MKNLKTIAVTIMVMAIVALSYICYQQNVKIERLEISRNTFSTYWKETLTERNELKRKNEEYEDLYDLCTQYFDKVTTDRYSKQAMNLASHNPQANIGYVLIFVDGNVKVGACADMDELEQIVASYEEGSILSGNYWYA